MRHQRITRRPLHRSLQLLPIISIIITGSYHQSQGCGNNNKKYPHIINLLTPKTNSIGHFQTRPRSAVGGRRASLLYFSLITSCTFTLLILLSSQEITSRYANALVSSRFPSYFFSLTSSF